MSKNNLINIFSKKKNYKAFHLTKNGKSTGVFLRAKNENNEEISQKNYDINSMDIGNVKNNEHSVKINLFKTERNTKKISVSNDVEMKENNAEIIENYK